MGENIILNKIPLIQTQCICLFLVCSYKEVNVDVKKKSKFYKKWSTILGIIEHMRRNPEA